jgi:DnaD/phage-associated family protein
MHQHDPADSLLLIPDSLKLKTDSLETDSGTNVSQSVGSPPADDLESVIQAYREHIGELGPAQLQVLKSWLEDQERNMAAEVVTEAIKIAAAMGKRRMSYVEGILRNWRNDGVESLEDIERLESANRRQRDDQRERRYDPEKYREILKEAGMLDEGAS